MSGKVFISCGQADQSERKATISIRNCLKKIGFDPYVAIEAQSIQDVNSGIIRNLTSADYYIFVDLPREKLSGSPEEYRGSLFTHQELAIAYTLGFEEVLFIKHSSVKLEGIGKYILGNARRFNDIDEVPRIVKQEIKQRGWSPQYSRHLIPRMPIPTRAIRYSDHTGSYTQYVYHVDVENRRRDVGALSAIASLEALILPSKQTISPDSSYLKWAGQIGYERTIPPNTVARFDAFAIEDQPGHNCVYLHSAADMYPRQPILQGQLGQFTLNYEVFAQGFPVLKFAVALNLTGNILTTTAQII